MRKIISKTFGLRDGEIFISFLMQLYVFIIISVLLIVKPTVNALFVSQLGADSLPYGYLLVAFVAVVTSYFYSKSIRKHSLVKIAVLSLFTFSLTFLGLAIILYVDALSSSILYFFYIFVSLFAVVATSQFWIFANMVFNAREAKRIFGFIGAGAIAGGIFGGYLTNIIAKNFGNEFAIFIASLMILGCIPIIRKVYKLRIRYLNTYKRKQVIANQDNLENSSIKIIKNSKHLTYVAFIVGISVVVAKLVDFQFSDFANKSIPDSDDLAAFFGFWFSTFNVVALCIQLFLTNRIVGKLGVSSTLLILPLAIGLGGLLFITFPELWVLILLKGIDGSFKQSLNKAAVELSVMPIPLQIKNQAKSYIDVAVDSIATGFAGFLLIFLIKKLDLATTYITVIILLFVFIWIVLIYKLREAYFNSFKKNIQRSLTLTSGENQNKRNRDTLENIEEIFFKGNEIEILNLFKKLKDYKLKVLQPSVIKLLNHSSNKVKIAAIDYLDYFDGNNILAIVEAFVREKDDALVYVSLDYILEHSKVKEADFFNKYLDHSSEYIANGALLSLAKQSENNKRLAQNYNLEGRIQDKIQLLKNQNDKPRKEVVAGLLLSIAYGKLTEHYHIIKKYLNSDKKYLVKFAIISAGIASSPVFLEDLVRVLQTKRYRRRAIKALKNYGPKIIDYILELDSKDELNSSVKKYIPKIIGSFKNQMSIDILVSVLKSKNSTSRVEASKALQKLLLKNENLHVDERIFKNSILKESLYYKNILEILSSVQHSINKELVDNSNTAVQQIYEARKKLIEALELELQKSLRVIFKLLGIIYNLNDIKIVQNALNSNIQEAKINSIELLENLLESNIKNSVLPIVEHNVVEDDNFDSSILRLNLLTELEYLQKLMKISGSNLRFLAVEFISITEDKNLLSALLPLKKYRNKTVKSLAYDTYTILKNKTD